MQWYHDKYETSGKTDSIGFISSWLEFGWNADVGYHIRMTFGGKNLSWAYEHGWTTYQNSLSDQTLESSLRERKESVMDEMYTALETIAQAINALGGIDALDFEEVDDICEHHTPLFPGDKNKYYDAQEWLKDTIWTEDYVYHWAARCNLRVERQGAHYTFYQGDHWDTSIDFSRTLGRYPLKEAVAFIAGYVEARQFFVG